LLLLVDFWYEADDDENKMMNWRVVKWAASEGD